MSTDFYTTSILPFAPIIIKICRAYTDTQEDFEDYYQEVCLQIWRTRNNFREEADWSTWIYRLTLNVCLTLEKKNKRKRSFLADKTNKNTPAAEKNQAFADETLNELYAAIRQLSEIDRAVIMLYLEEKPYNEIAEILGTNANNIGVRVKRIKERLKKILDGKIH